MESEGKKGLGSFQDQDSILHKLMTYGVTILTLLLCVFLSPGKTISPVWGWMVIVFLLYYALVSKRILETLIFGSAICVALYYGTGFLNGFSKVLMGQMKTDDFVWMVLLCGLLNVFNKLLSRAGSMNAFGSIIEKHAKNEKQLNLFAWLLQFPLFFDDYMTIAVGGSILAPIYDKKKTPREEGAFIVHSLAEPLRTLLPITSWTAFMSGLFESGGLKDSSGSGFGAFVRTIPFNFYAWVSLIGTLLFAIGIIPKIGLMKHPDSSVYMPLDENEEGAGGDTKAAKRGNLVDFFLPIAGMIAAAAYFGWDLVPALFVVLPCVFAYYMLRGIITTKDIEGCLVDGLKEFMYLDVLFVTSYALGSMLDKIGYISYLVNATKNAVNPALLPVMLFVIFCVSEAAMSLNWNLLLIAFPVVIPLAQGIGANVYLTAAAVIAAGCFGCHLCYVCDYTSMTASVSGLPSAYHASTCVPYALIFAAVTAVLFLTFGFIV
jgi:Na+/H+ antiporter NhaC